jgi:2-hydroxychromene-2-carboxylate isomerase
MHPLKTDAPLIVYLDFKSPYAYLAKDPTYALENRYGIEIDWRPLTLNIGSYLGTAKVDDTGKVVEAKRTNRQWAAVKYAYHDAKRYARLRDLTLLGPRQIWDSSPGSIGMLWAKQQGREVLHHYMDLVFERFWRREFEIDNPDVVAAAISEAGGDAAGFPKFFAGEGRARHDALQDALHPAGIYGVPTYVINEEPFFGREHLPYVHWQLAGRNGPAPDVSNQVDVPQDVH